MKNESFFLKRVICTLMFFFIKAKPKSMIKIGEYSFQFSYKKEAKPTLKKSDALS